VAIGSHNNNNNNNNNKRVCIAQQDRNFRGAGNHAMSQLQNAPTVPAGYYNTLMINVATVLSHTALPHCNMTLVYKYLSRISFHNARWPGDIMIRTLDSRLRGRGFDSQLFRFQTSMVETLCIFKSDSKILRMCRIPTNCLSAIRIPSFMSDAIVVYINSRPFCTGQPYYGRSQTDNGAFINYIRSGGIVSLHITTER